MLAKKMLLIVMNLLTIGAIAGAAVGCSKEEKVHSTWEKSELCDEYLEEHGWVYNVNYDMCTFTDSDVSDRYFYIKIFTKGRDYPTVIDTIYYE